MERFQHQENETTTRRFVVMKIADDADTKYLTSYSKDERSQGASLRQRIEHLRPLAANAGFRFRTWHKFNSLKFQSIKLLSEIVKEENQPTELKELIRWCKEHNVEMKLSCSDCVLLFRLPRNSRG